MGVQTLFVCMGYPLPQRVLLATQALDRNGALQEALKKHLQRSEVPAGNGAGVHRDSGAGLLRVRMNPNGEPVVAEAEQRRLKGKLQRAFEADPINQPE
jgi:hypothetical protein